MPSVRRSLIIPVETQNRELDAKLLLSCFAAEAGFRVIVGSKKEINNRIGSLPRSIFVSKSLTNRNARLYGILQELGHPIVCGDEEGLIWFSPEHYLKTKVGDEAFVQAEALLAWGGENARNWREAPSYAGAPIHVTGNARVDLLRPELRGYFAPRAEELRRRFGRMILINTNFGRLNHYYPGQSRQRKVLEDAVRGQGGADEFAVGLAGHRMLLFEHFQTMVGAVARAHPECAVVIRPHPSESHTVWHAAGGNRPNVHVLHEGNVVPWLLAADVMIHNGCTTGVESYLLDRPSIAFQPVTSERFDLHLSNGLSIQAFDAESLLARVGEGLAGRLEPDAEVRGAQRKLIDQHVAATRGAFACERIVETLTAFGDGLAPERDAPPATAGTRGRVRAGLRHWRKRLEARIPGHRNNREYVRHMFPGIRLDEARATAARFGELLGRFQRVRVEQRFHNVFELTAD